MPLGSTTSPEQASDQMAASGAGSGWDAASAPQQPPSQAPPAAPQQPASPQSAQSPAATPPAAPGASGGAVAAAATPAPVQPVVVTSQKRGGIMGVVDSIADALAGKTKPEIGTDKDGNQYIKQDTLTRGQQWVRIGAGLVAGAAKGWAAGRGRNPGAAAAAGFDAGQKQAQDAAQQTPELQKQMLANANYQKLRMDAAEQSWHLAAMKHEATQHDVEFAQAQEDRLMKVDGATLLGTAEHPGDINSILKADPNVMESMIENHQIEILPHYNPDGTAGGIRVFKMPDRYRKTIMPAGSVFHTFDSTTGHFVEHHSSVPLTAGEIDDYETAASNAAQKFNIAQATLEKTQQETATSKATASKVPSEIAENKARAAASYATADKDRAETAVGAPGAVQADISEGLASGRYVMGKDIPLRTSKDQTTAAQYTKAADDYSRANFGLPYSPEIIRQEAKLAESPKTQAFLSGIDRMVGTPGMPGQLDQVLDLARRAGLGNSAPFNELKLWVKKNLGTEAAKNFESGLSDTQTGLGTLIGNPLLGSGESDLKLKTAQGQFGSNPTLGNLQGAVTTTKQILERARGELARNNRYIQQRYGTYYSPKQGQGAANGQHVFNSTAWAAANPGKDVNAAIAAAKQQGYQVTQ